MKRREPALNSVSLAPVAGLMPNETVLKLLSELPRVIVCVPCAPDDGILKSATTNKGAEPEPLPRTARAVIVPGTVYGVDPSNAAQTQISKSLAVAVVIAGAGTFVENVPDVWSVSAPPSNGVALTPV